MKITNRMSSSKMIVIQILNQEVLLKIQDKIQIRKCQKCSTSNQCNIYLTTTTDNSRIPQATEKDYKPNQTRRKKILEICLLLT